MILLQCKECNWYLEGSKIFIEIVDFIINFYKGFKLIYGCENYFLGCFILLGFDNCDEK